MYQELNRRVRSNQASFGSTPVMWGDTYRDLNYLESLYQDAVVSLTRNVYQQREELRNAEDEYEFELHFYKYESDKKYLEEARMMVGNAKYYIEVAEKILSRAWSGLKKVQALKSSFESAPPTQSTTPSARTKKPAQQQIHPTKKPGGLDMPFNNTDTLIGESADQVGKEIDQNQYHGVEIVPGPGKAGGGGSRY